MQIIPILPNNKIRHLIRGGSYDVVLQIVHNQIKKTIHEGQKQKALFTNLTK
jgi:hypothetical protein